jgi:hypothetical protein
MESHEGPQITPLEKSARYRNSALTPGRPFLILGDFNRERVANNPQLKR